MVPEGFEILHCPMTHLLCPQVSSFLFAACVPTTPSATAFLVVSASGGHLRNWFVKPNKSRNPITAYSA